MKKAFTLIELLIVVGIIAVLMGTLVAALSGGTDAARAARCLTNLKNLASACNSYAMACTHYPLAGSAEIKEPDLDSIDSSGVQFIFTEYRGWLSWDSRGAYEGKTTSHVASGGWFTSAYNQTFDVRQHALTNGALWRYVSENADVFVCPAHKKSMRKQNPLWSYVMNERFGYDTSLGEQAIPYDPRIRYDGLPRADRVLMFAELQFLDNDKVEVSTDSGSGIRNDCTLQYNHNEVIGFNHPNGKRGLFAHVVFADGHAEKLMIPASPSGAGWAVAPSRGDLEDLTEWLCQGKDVSLNGSRYEKLND
ncbi:MAG: prepilin-type N-terminal cleavage/methylation domain-containing protein [Kiritimatiellae bacterium]|nr:prepilin-type N-terminal cleavage/methylation domain-containing protein [Kiritimatiellia bacterium]